MDIPSFPWQFRQLYRRWLAANYHFSNGTVSSPWLIAKTIAFNGQVGSISKVIDGT